MMSLSKPRSMNKRATLPADDPLVCRCLLDGDRGGEVFHRWIEADERAAKLSPAFRAYYLLRSAIPLSVRQLLQRSRRVETCERWYVPDAFVDALTREVAALHEGIATLHPWPDGHDFAFVLTHDVETADGMRNVLRVAELEEELGFRSSWNIVPYKYPIDRGLVRELSNRGFEIGVHGYNHDGRLFASRRVFDARVPAINAALEAFGAVGFRAPMVHRNLHWLQSLEVEYDASCFDADPYQAMPGGVGSIWPFIAGRFVELPYTLPQDHTLFVALNEQDGRIWRQKLAYLRALRGMSLVITHPDYLDSQQRLEIYRRFLVETRDLERMWHTLPRDVATWWRERDGLIRSAGPDDGGHLAPVAVGRARNAVLRALAHDHDGTTRLELHWAELPASISSRTEDVSFSCLNQT
jgi:peptidoglycan/xylan/chitin deacetylase (PgdA/CDA1 family)